MPRRASLCVLTVTAALAVVGSARSASAEDRYGPPPPAADGPAGAAPATGWLSWSMKTPAPTAISRPAAPAWSQQRLERPAAPAPVEAAPARVATAALPTSLYSAYPARQSAAETAPARAPWTPSGPSEAAQPPHFYSVHRQFGLAPDPIPLPRQFFAADTPDLAAPPPPLAPHPVPGTQAATSPANTPANRAREVEIETADSAAN